MQIVDEENDILENKNIDLTKMKWKKANFKITNQERIDSLL